MNQIATQDEGQQVTIAKVIGNITEYLENRPKGYYDKLPSHLPPERFKTAVKLSLNRDQGFVNVDRDSLLTAIAAAANDGLLPDGREGAFVRFKNACQWMPMIAGIVKKARQSGDVLELYAEVVFANDEFDYALGDQPYIQHKPAKFGEPRGEAIGCYAICKMTNGGIEREVMEAAQIKAVEAVSRSNKGPWKGNFKFEMWRKTVLRRLSKRLPLSSDLLDVIQGPDTAADFDAEVAATPKLTSDMLEQQSNFDPAEAAEPEGEEAQIEEIEPEAPSQTWGDDEDRPAWVDTIEELGSRLRRAQTYEQARDVRREFGGIVQAVPDKQKDAFFAELDRIEESLKGLA